MSRFGSFQLERRIQFQSSREVCTALALAPGHAADESQIFVGGDLIGIAEACVDRILEAQRGVVVFAVFLAFYASRELRIAFALKNAFDVLHGLRGTAAQRGKTYHQQQNVSCDVHANPN